MPDRSNCSYVRVAMDGSLAANAFACRWPYNGKTVCWVTQLVVHQKYRERGLATGLLRLLGNHDDDIYGIMSSHPAACLAASKAFASKRRFAFVANSEFNAEYYRFHQQSPT